MESITLSEQAAEHIKKIFEDQDDAEGIRIVVKGGGCGGFQYGFNFVLKGEKLDDDMVFEEHGLKVVVDPISYQYLQGSSIELETELMGTRFVIRNPNITRTCGCGSSFSTE